MRIEARKIRTLPRIAPKQGPQVAYDVLEGLTADAVTDNILRLDDHLLLPMSGF
jgi:hypothetical protein